MQTKSHTMNTSKNACVPTTPINKEPAAKQTSSLDMTTITPRKQPEHKNLSQHTRTCIKLHNQPPPSMCCSLLQARCTSWPDVLRRCLCPVLLNPRVMRWKDCLWDGRSPRHGDHKACPAFRFACLQVQSASRPPAGPSTLVCKR